MNQSVTTSATMRNRVPTIQCFVQKHAPEAKKMSVAAMEMEFRPAKHCTRHCIEVIP